MRLIERLIERTLITDFLDDLAAGRPPAELDVCAARLGCDLSERHVIVAAEPGSGAVEKAVGAPLPVRSWTGPTTAYERSHASLALVLLRSRMWRRRAPRRPTRARGRRRTRRRWSRPRTRSRRPPCSPPAEPRAGLRDIGPYRYLLPIAAGVGTRDEMVERVGLLAAYDAERQTQLLATLEARFVHQNTLRQRQRRIAEGPTPICGGTTG